MYLLFHICPSRECIGQNIRAHLKCFLPNVGGIAMDLRIFPSVAKIGLIRVQKNDAALASKDKCLRFLSIVCMDFGKSFIQFKGVVEEKGAAPQGFKLSLIHI